MGVGAVRPLKLCINFYQFNALIRTEPPEAREKERRDKQWSRFWIGAMSVARAIARSAKINLSFPVRRFSLLVPRSISQLFPIRSKVHLQLIDRYQRPSNLIVVCPDKKFPTRKISIRSA